MYVHVASRDRGPVSQHSTLKRATRRTPPLISRFQLEVERWCAADSIEESLHRRVALRLLDACMLPPRRLPLALADGASDALRKLVAAAQRLVGGELRTQRGGASRERLLWQRQLQALERHQQRRRGGPRQCCLGKEKNRMKKKSYRRRGGTRRMMPVCLAPSLPDLGRP